MSSLHQAILSDIYMGTLHKVVEGGCLLLISVILNYLRMRLPSRALELISISIMRAFSMLIRVRCGTRMPYRRTEARRTRTDKIHYLLQYIAQYFHDLYKVEKQWSDLTNIDDFITGLKENVYTHVSSMQLMPRVCVCVSLWSLMSQGLFFI